MKLVAFGVLFAIIVFFDLDIKQIDIKTAFLFNLINHLVYVNIPQTSKIGANRNIIYKLLKVLYNLKQS